MAKYIFITGGVVSSLGKGIAAASLASLLKLRGFKVRLRKLDPYLNIDPGTMSPYQHGEVFVTDDGAETDLDLGHYERFIDLSLSKDDAITSGRVYSDVLQKERKGDYLGGTVQVIPHVTDMIKQFITVGSEDTDFLICEIGGTVGDIEGLPFVEAIRQMGQENRGDVLFLHLTLLPYIPSAGELKTKPTQHSVKELRSIGIQPDILLCRSDRSIPVEERQKIALFCNVRPSSVIEARDLRTIYEVPRALHNNKLDEEVLRHFGIVSPEPDLSAWDFIVKRFVSPENSAVTVGVVGKYTGLLDAYKSLQEALIHGGIANNLKVNIRWINAELLEEEWESHLKNLDGILVPGGFGSRGIKGKIRAIHYARENKIPYLGICLGMQMAVIETVQNILNISNAGSAELEDEACEEIIGIMTEWEKDGKKSEVQEKNMGGTMRLGAYPAILQPQSLISKIYNGEVKISERHRHRYEVNMTYADRLKEAGMEITGLSPDGKLPEVIERPDHPWFVGVQYHPELKSRPFKPHPLFQSFVEACAVHAIT